MTDPKAIPAGYASCAFDEASEVGASRLCTMNNDGKLYVSSNRELKGATWLRPMSELTADGEPWTIMPDVDIHKIPCRCGHFVAVDVRRLRRELGQNTDGYKAGLERALGILPVVSVPEMPPRELSESYREGFDGGVAAALDAASDAIRAALSAPASLPPTLTADDVHAALKRDASGANELNRTLAESKQRQPTGLRLSAPASEGREVEPRSLAGLRNDALSWLKSAGREPDRIVANCMAAFAVRSFDRAVHIVKCNASPGRYRRQVIGALTAAMDTTPAATEPTAEADFLSGTVGALDVVLQRWSEGYGPISDAEGGRLVQVLSRDSHVEWVRKLSAYVLQLSVRARQLSQRGRE